MPGALVEVHGLRELNQAFRFADRDLRRIKQGTLRRVAEPVRSDAEQLAHVEISHIGRRWFKMRTGVTRDLIYVAPRQRGVKVAGPDPRKRPNLAGLLANKAMDPALERHEHEIEQRLEHALDELADHFNHGSSTL